MGRIVPEEGSGAARQWAALLRRTQTVLGEYTHGSLSPVIKHTLNAPVILQAKHFYDLLRVAVGRLHSLGPTLQQLRGLKSNALSAQSAGAVLRPEGHVEYLRIGSLTLKNRFVDHLKKNWEGESNTIYRTTNFPNLVLLPSSMSTRSVGRHVAHLDHGAFS